MLRFLWNDKNDVAIVLKDFYQNYLFADWFVVPEEYKQFFAMLRFLWNDKSDVTIILKILT